MTDVPAASERLLLIFRRIEADVTASGGLAARRIDDRSMKADIPPPNSFQWSLHDGEAVIRLFCDGLFDITVTWREHSGCWDALCRITGPVSPKSEIHRCIRAFGLDPLAVRHQPLTDLKASSLIIWLARAARSG